LSLVALAAPDGLWLLHIHHAGELEKSSVFAPRATALTTAARCLASAVHCHEAGSVLRQSCQKVSICLKRGMFGDATMRSPSTAFQLHAPRL
jgi:hypothetical protein